MFIINSFQYLPAAIKQHWIEQRQDTKMHRYKNLILKRFREENAPLIACFFFFFFDGK